MEKGRDEQGAGEVLDTQATLFGLAERGARASSRTRKVQSMLSKIGRHVLTPAQSVTELDVPNAADTDFEYALPYASFLGSAASITKAIETDRAVGEPINGNGRKATALDEA